MRRLFEEKCDLELVLILAVRKAAERGARGRGSGDSGREGESFPVRSIRHIERRRMDVRRGSSKVTVDFYTLPSISCDFPLNSSSGTYLLSHMRKPKFSPESDISDSLDESPLNTAVFVDAPIERKRERFLGFE